MIEAIGVPRDNLIKPYTLYPHSLPVYCPPKNEIDFHIRFILCVWLAVCDVTPMSGQPYATRRNGHHTREYEKK